MVREFGLHAGQYRTREDDGLGELQLQAIERAVDECRFTVLIASSAARWDKLAGFAAGLAQHAGLDGGVPRLIIIARDFTPSSEAERARLSLGQRALVGLDCSDDDQTTAALARLRKLLALDEPVDDRPACPYPGLARFTAANRGPPALALQALRHVPRRCPGAPQAPSAASSPGTGSQATWHYAAPTRSGIIASPEREKDRKIRSVASPRNVSVSATHEHTNHPHSVPD